MENLNQNEQTLLYACKNNHIELAEWILHVDTELGIVNQDVPFCIACEYNSLEVAIFLYKYIKFHDIAIYYKLLLIICEEGYFRLISSLYDFFSYAFQKLDHHQQYNLFVVACKNANISIAEILYVMNPELPIYLNNNELFWDSYKCNDLPIVHLLTKIFPNRYYAEIVDYEVISCEIINNLIVNKKVNQYDIRNVENCFICYDKANLYTICKHFYCMNCLEQHYIHNDIKCPYCRRENLECDMFEII